MAMAYADVLEGGKRSRDQGLAAASSRGDGLEERSRAPAAAPALSHEDVTNIQFTSGTTGLPKAVGLTHRNIVNNGRFVARGMRLTSDDAVCLPVPLFHCFGLVLGSLACISTGAAIVFPSRTFDPRAALQAVQEERCSALYGVPTMFLAQLALSDFGSFSPYLPLSPPISPHLPPPPPATPPSRTSVCSTSRRPASRPRPFPSMARQTRP